MSGRIDIPVGLNASGVARGAKDAERELEKLEDAVNAVGRGGARDSEKLERALRDVQRQADRTEKSVDDVGGKGFKRAGEATAEFKTEAASNFSEVTSSFDGSMSSIQDLAQGTLGGLASSGLPGIGIAAGVAAAGVGLIGAGFTAAEEQAAALRDRANELADAYIEAGNTVLSTTQVAAATAEILTDDEQRKKAEALADALGVDLATAARAYAGDANAMALANKIAGESQDEWTQLAAKSADYLNNQLSPAESKRYDQLTAQRTAMYELNQVTGMASETFATQQAVLVGLINDADGATREVDKLGNELYTLPDGEQILIDADTGKATTDVQNFKGDLDGLKEQVTAPIRFEPDLTNVYSALARFNPTVTIRGRIFTRDGKEVF